ncbi:hypothetical protein [Psychrobacter cryohalolentis]|uniref:hypothetical protein n=1 Tax=Psychrobacter cryohalolentis TaxID=330922 RepID=UPI003F82C95C
MTNDNKTNLKVDHGQHTQIIQEAIMPNSIRTTSNTQITTNSTQAGFKAGDIVLCPSVGFAAYKLFNDKEYGCLGFALNGKTYHYRDDGKVSRDDSAPSLFYNTPANRQAINTLYGSKHRIKTIDCTDADDDEVILMPSIMLSDIACDVFGAAEVMQDIGQLLNLIYREDISSNQVKSMARLVHDTTDRWHSILNHRLDTLNKPLEQTGFGKVEG